MPVSLAPHYPEAGYFPTNIAHILQQRREQQKDIAESCMDERAAGKPAPCDMVLNISLFFDGTNNHGDSDDKANPVCSSNIRRLYNATIGEVSAQKSGYFSYYMQGVGTEFKKIGEDGPSSSGLSFASGGERRILWGLTRLIDALQQSLISKEVDDRQAMKVIQQMEFTYKEGNHGVMVKTGTSKDDRRAAMKAGMSDVLAKLDSKPTILKIKLYIYGFSRGAAEARAFLWRLDEQMQDSAFFGIPLTVEFLGVLDTVASVGLTELAPGAQGHMDWADGTMQLPQREWLKRCAHLVSAHEQRLCFPLDSVATTTQGAYPSCVVGEWVYPGMHSDVGGGYPPNDQGKAREGQEMLLSQIPLNHLYRLAFDAGAPLKIDASRCKGGTASEKSKIKMLQSSEPWRFFDKNTSDLFMVETQLIQRFNAWRHASRSGGSLIDLIKNQTAQINAWRIERYAGGLHGSGGQSQETTDYYKYAATERETPDWAIKQEKDAWETQSKKGKASATKMKWPEHRVSNINGRGSHVEPVPEDSMSANDKAYVGRDYQPNLSKGYEPTLDGTQLRMGAKDFRDDYLGLHSVDPNPLGWLASLFTAISRPFSADCTGTERAMLIKHSEAKYQKLIQNADLMLLFDEHVHDSRAWFMQSTLGKLEPHGSYWRYRTIFFTDDDNNKKLICKAPDSEKDDDDSAAAAEQPDQGTTTPSKDLPATAF
ncbi:hypothetical protein DLM_1582 [Aquitalea magnusonii]|uniref:DUF2235 domain-containing protein n=1 Tax=Aquitalea magnusonii TaxID=332411 RepID=A0A3G9GG23_9NEIS|nr:DUF2235 domain-containing protein [Aquitalea magnusonii]BBF85201.1 hypothetical protein DLM_1582 [Aquitalea magnusonii]